MGSFTKADSQAVDLGGQQPSVRNAGAVQIGAYSIADGSSEGSGCMTNVTSGQTACPGGSLYNDGSVADSATQLVITTPTLAGTFSSPASANLGPITVMLEDANGNPLQAGYAGVTINLSSTSPTGIFAVSSGGSSITSVTIPAGSSQAAFYYGDSAVATPTITASASGLLAATQVESIGPIVSSISPQQGPTSGNTTVTVTGSGFNPSSKVLFGTRPAASTTYVSSTQLQATSAPATAGVVDMMVVTNGAQSLALATDRFAYGSPSNYRGVSTQQYSLSNSNGSSWSRVDASKLTLTVIPLVTSSAVLSANASLFINTAGVNQDLGITVTPTPTDCARSPVVWKESGGGLAFHPNPVSMEIACTFSQGQSYTVQLVWKSNVSTSATIYAGAGPSAPFSPTVISASLTPVSGSLVQAKTGTGQYPISSTSWTPLDSTNLATTMTFGSTTTARLSADADLWVNSAGVNADLGICVVLGTSLNQCTAANVVAWEEAGGSSSFQSIPSAVQTIYNFPTGQTYTVGLVGRTSASGTAYAGAGSSPNFSPTVLLINSATSPIQAVVTTQEWRPNSSPNNGTSWQDMDATNLSLTLTPTQDSLVYLSANASLFTNSTAFNADLGICIYTAPAPACDPAGSTIAAWTESGTAATFNPDANLVQIPIPVSAGKTYTVRLQWRTNASMPANATMYSGAGSNPFSPTSISASLVGCPCPVLAGGSQLVITTPSLTGAATSPASANVGPITVGLEDARGAPIAAGTGGVAVNLSSPSSITGVFAASSGGTSITSVTIPAGMTATTFYYGDSTAGTPTIEAAAAPALGLSAVSQAEMLKSGRK